MKNYVLALLGLCLATPWLVQAADMPGVVFGDAVTVTAQVVAIDKEDRSVALKGPEGNVVVVEVGKAAYNFDKIQVGDTVKLSYYRAVAIYLGPPGSQPDVDVEDIVARAPKGQKPAAADVEAVDIAVSVLAVDRASRTLTVTGPEGNVFSMQVDPSIAAFDQVNVGDSIHLRYIEAVAISVTAK